MSKIKKFLSLAIVAIIAIIGTNVGSASAAGGKFDPIGSDPGISISRSYHKLSTLTSGGGDYQVRVTSNRTGGSIIIDLYVDGKYFDTEVVSSTGNATFRGIGSGKKKVYAEAKTTGSTNFVSFRYYD
ncbi:hypothetical protein [Priestia megaterium]|uniref:hypothetical protein n=1 Tax=Priestia megaterium TaxID=1404 RepID=UPI002FFE9855